MRNSRRVSARLWASTGSTRRLARAPSASDRVWRARVMEQGCGAARCASSAALHRRVSPPKARRSFPDNTGYSMASTARFDVAAIGNAIVDVIARTDDAPIEAEGLVKGSMRLIDAPAATRLYAAMGPAVERSGGSAANPLAGLAALGRRSAFVGQIGRAHV